MVQPDTILASAVVAAPPADKAPLPPTIDSSLKPEKNTRPPVSITVDSGTSEDLFGAALTAVHRIASQQRLATKDTTNRREQLKGRKMLFICCGLDELDSKRFVFERAAELGVRCFLVEDPHNTLAITMEKEQLVEKLIRVELKPRTLFLLDNVIAAVNSVGGEVGGFDGVCTFWDDAVSLYARVAERLNLPGHSPRSTDIAHDKHLTREAMRGAGLPTPASYLLKCEADVDVATGIVEMPAILKPVYGSASYGVVKVNKVEEVRAAYRRCVSMLKEVYARKELMGLVFNESEVGRSIDESSLLWLVMEEYLDGDEVDVDLIVRDGKPVYKCVVDDWPQIQVGVGWLVC